MASTCWEIAPFTVESSAVKHHCGLTPLETFFCWSVCISRDLKADGCKSNLYVMLKQLLLFIYFTTYFLGSILS